MQYLEYALVGLAFLLFMAVVFGLLVMFLAKMLLKPKVRPAPAAAPAAAHAAIVYPVPPGERGKHTTLLDLVDEMTEAENAHRRRRKLTRKVYDWFNAEDADPKPPPAE